MSVKISAVMLARNEEANIDYCLRTLGWCDEVVVVDMASSDRTAELAAARGAVVYPHPFVDEFDKVKKTAVEKAAGDWIFMVDADEMVPQPLAAELRRRAEEGAADVVEVPFNHFIMGAKVRRSGWGYAPQPRFFRKGKVVFSGVIHRYFAKTEGAAAVRLPLEDRYSIQHFNYTDSAHFVGKLNRYTGIEAGHLYAAGARFTYLSLLRAAFREFYRRFITERGFKEGPRGFFLSFMMGFYKALSYIKLWELQEYSSEPVSAVYDRERRSVLAGWEN